MLPNRRHKPFTPSSNSNVQRGKEEVLSLDLPLDLEDDLWYRIRRGNRFVYVQVKTPNIIPPSAQTQSCAILKNLRALPLWFSDWQTLTVSGQKDSPICDINLFRPHCVSRDKIRRDIRQYSLADIAMEQRISDRVFVGRHLDGQTCVVKIARFEYELDYLTTELQAYEAYQKHGLKCIPQLYGYVYEESSDRVVGFAMEHLAGRHAEAQDLEQCRKLLQSVHKIGFIHGDLNRYNWIVSENGLKLLDLENSVSQSESDQTAAGEMAALPSHLHDDSGAGRRFTWDI